MGRRMWVALMVAAIIALLCLGGYAYDRRNCVCYTALHSPGTFLHVDKRASDALGDHQLSNETISLVTVKCRHACVSWQSSTVRSRRRFRDFDRNSLLLSSGRA